MKNKKIQSAISFALAVILAFSCLTILTSAKSIAVVKQPDKRNFYQGIDWFYDNNNAIKFLKDPDLKGTVLSDGSKNVEYSAVKTPNMFSRADSGKWVEGSNTMRIYCDDFSGYATTTIKLFTVSSVSIVTPPSNTFYVKGLDWNPGPLGDVEFTKCDLTGLKINALYSDGTSKQVSYPENKLLGWSVGSDYSEIYPGKATLYATFCGKSAPFEVEFSNTNPFTLGDVTKDGKINSHDALVILQYATGSIALDSSKLRLADINKDSYINSLDALLILQYTVGKISSL